MDFLNDINSETLIICPDNYKDKIINSNSLRQIKVMDMNEFIHNRLFSYDEDAILFLMDKYNFSYEISLMYLKQLYYIEDKNYDNKKLDFLNEIKNLLDDNNLLIYKDYFNDYLKRVKIVILGIRLTPFLEKLFDGFDYKIIDINKNDYKHDVYEFNSMEDEVYYVTYKICELIDNGVSPEKIKIINIDDSYYNTINRIFRMHNLRINLPYKMKLGCFNYIKDVIKMLDVLSLDEIIEKIDNKNKLYDEVVKIFNKYSKFNSVFLLKYKLENSFIQAFKYDLGINTSDLFQIYDEDEYVFLMNFNDGMIPKSYKDTDYITDNIRSLVGLVDTRVLNKWLREDILKQISNIKNLIITYKTKDNKRSFYPSSLCSNFKVIHDELSFLNSYSETYGKLNLVRRIDDYIKFGNVSMDFATLKNNYSVKYNSYDNSYSLINRTLDNLVLSYSKMQIYNKCAFRYYLTDVLKIDKFESNFSTVIGSMVHYALEKSLSNNDYNTDKYADEYLGDKVFNNKEKFFIEKYKMGLKELVGQILIEREYSLFNMAFYEKKIVIPIEENITFMGIIDKVLYYVKDNQTYISLIDYKTGNDSISLKYLKYGLDIQLPIYLYLSTKLEFSNPLYVGFYLQKFNIKDKDYRLQGYSNSDKDILSVIDKNYMNSIVIKSMRTLKDGSFAKYSKVLSNQEIDSVKEAAYQEILKVVNKIKNNDFSINPKVIDNVNRGCEFCKFNDICDVRKKDYEIITTEDNEEGDING